MIEIVQSTSGFHVYSDLNTWIDFMIVIGSYEDFTEAEEIIKKAEDTYWTDGEAESETMADWIGRKLEDNDISFEIFFKDEEEEDW